MIEKMLTLTEHGYSSGNDIGRADTHVEVESVCLAHSGILQTYPVSVKTPIESIDTGAGTHNKVVYPVIGAPLKI